MMNKGVKGKLAEGTGEGELLAEITRGADSDDVGRAFRLISATCSD
jgi:hypothetical protein